MSEGAAGAAPRPAPIERAQRTRERAGHAQRPGRQDDRHNGHREGQAKHALGDDSLVDPQPRQHEGELADLGQRGAHQRGGGQWLAEE